MKEDNLVALIDSNVIIDAVTARPNCDEMSKRVFLMCVSGEIHGCLLSKQLTDINYVLKRYMVEKQKRKTFISFLLKAFDVLPFDETDVAKGLSLNGKDFEDDCLTSTCLRLNIGVIITNNEKDFDESIIKAIAPKRLIDIK